MKNFSIFILLSFLLFQLHLQVSLLSIGLEFLPLSCHTCCYAMEEEHKFVSFNPATNVIIPKATTVPKKKTRTQPHVYVPVEQMEQIFKRFPEGQPTHISLLLGYRCGLRLGEVFGITWDDIDLKKKTISINRQVQWYSNTSLGRGGNRREDTSYGYWYFTEPKYRSYRIINLDDDTCQLLKREKDLQTKAEEMYSIYNRFTRYYANEALTYGGTVPEQISSPMNRIGTKITEYEIPFLCRREKRKNTNFAQKRFKNVDETWTTSTS